MNPSNLPKVSLILLTRNGLPLLRECLERVFAQRTDWRYEVLVIDSGSTDGTLELVRQSPARVLQIPRVTFSHGATRNFAAENARGEFLVYLVQDAIPTSNDWLLHLVQAAETDGAAASYGRQLPQPNSHALIRRTMERCYPESSKRVVKRLPPQAEYAALTPLEQFQLAIFTDCCSCIRKSVWSEHRLATIPYGEDIEWAKRVLEAGYAIVYEPTAIVYHSHDRSAWYEFKRAYADHDLVFRLFGLQLIPSLGKGFRTVAWGTQDSWQAVLHARAALLLKVRLFAWSPILVTAQVAGQYLGARAVLLQRIIPNFRYVDALFRHDV